MSRSFDWPPFTPPPSRHYIAELRANVRELRKRLRVEVEQRVEVRDDAR